MPVVADNYSHSGVISAEPAMSLFFRKRCTSGSDQYRSMGCRMAVEGRGSSPGRSRRRPGEPPDYK